MTEEFKMKLKYFDDPVLSLELLQFVCGDFISQGIHRDVYEYALDKDWVIKIENKDGHGENWAEYRTWGAVMNTKHKKWFAESSWISNSGLVMMQKRTQPFEIKAHKKPDRIPNFFTDLKPSNFGWIKNQLVCHDYSFCLEKFTSSGGLSNRTQKFEFTH